MSDVIQGSVRCLILTSLTGAILFKTDKNIYLKLFQASEAISQFKTLLQSVDNKLCWKSS